MTTTTCFVDESSRNCLSSPRYLVHDLAALEDEEIKLVVVVGELNEMDRLKGLMANDDFDCNVVL